MDNAIGTFKKCDLHVHSASCYSRKGKYAQDDFIKALMKSDLDVAAVTDHNIVDVALYDYLSGVMGDVGKTLLPGCELNVCLNKDTITTNNLILGKGRKGKYFHGIIWTSPEFLRAFSHAIGSLFADIGCYSNEQYERAATTSDVTDARELFIALSQSTRGNCVELEETQRALRSIPHFFTFHEGKSDRNLSDYLPNRDEHNKLIASNLAFKDKLFYYSNGVGIEGGTVTSKIAASMMADLDTTVSHLFFSDAQELRQIGARFTWIDFDGDLDSLLLALTDPESRIRTSYDSPGQPQTNLRNYLEAVRFSMAEEQGGREVEICFSPSYNGIVGSRGSGKTMLASILAGNAQSYSALVDPQSIRFRRCGGDYLSDKPKALVMSQGYLEKLFQRQGYADIPFLKERIEQLEHQIQSKSNEAFEAIKDDLNVLQEALMLFFSAYPEGARSIDVLLKPKPEGLALEFPADHMVSDRSQLTAFKQTLSSLSAKLHEIVKVTDATALDAVFPENSALFEGLWNEYQTIAARLSEINADLEMLQKQANNVDDGFFEWRQMAENEFIKLLNEYNSQDIAFKPSEYVAEVNASSKFFLAFQALRLLFNDIETEIKNLYETMLTPLEPLSFELDSSRIVTVSAKYKAVRTYEEHVSDLLSQTGRGTDNVMLRLSIDSSSRQNPMKYFNRTKLKNVSNDRNSYVAKFFDVLSKETDNDRKTEEQVSVNGKSLTEMSPGTQAQVLLELFLHDVVNRGYAYIILDQPEDNLDTKTIKDFLVDRLKKLKRDIQIFVVSHSAPVIINGDAREVILCHEESGYISYSQGTINDKPLKKEIANVLDGGERYLRMRLDKYNFQIGDHDA